MRRKDAIFTFNWDPFLFDAYQRNYLIAPLPQIYFLHGNVRIGACKICEQWGRKFALCPTCNKNFTHVPLLYPVKKKDYFTDNQYTANSWKCAEDLFSDAFTITIFGYSAPESDLHAKDLLKKAWLKKSSRAFEHVELIDILNQNDIYDRWKDFTPTGHLSLVTSFEESRLNFFPRRSCEALFYGMSEGFPCKRYPIERTGELNKLQNEIKKIAQYESTV